MNKIECIILGGINYNGSNYICVLEDRSGIKLPVVVNDDIATKMITNSDTLIGNILDNMDGSVSEVLISDLSVGIFEAKIKLNNGNSFNSNISEALLIQKCTNCPIYVNVDVMKEAGIKLTEDNNIDYSEISYDDHTSVEVDDDIKDVEELLQQAIEDEDFELAAKLRDKLNSKTN